MKGILEISVYDKDGNLKQHQKGENIITNYYRDLLIAGADMRLNTLSGCQQYDFIYEYKKIVPQSKGIILFENQLVEDPDNYFEQLITAKEIGHAGDLADTGSAKFGVFNEGQFENTTSGIKYQWIFGEGKAVGIIKSVGLCNTQLGNRGLSDIHQYELTNVYDNQSNAFKVSGENTYINEEEQPVTIIGMHNGYIYGYIYNNNTATIALYRFNTNGLTNISNTFQNYIKNAYYPQRQGIVMEHYKDISLTISETTNTYTYLMHITLINGTIYALGYNSAITTTMFLHKENVEDAIHTYADLHFEQHGLVIVSQYKANFMGISLKNNKFYLLSDSGDNAYKKLVQYSLSAMVYEQTVDIPIEKFTKTDGVTVVLPGRIHQVGDDYFSIGTTTGSNRIMYLTDGVNYNMFCLNDSNMFRYDRNKAVLCRCGASITAMVDNTGLFTIKNLAGDVIKGETDTMVVTYRLINQ